MEYNVKDFARIISLHFKKSFSKVLKFFECKRMKITIGANENYIMQGSPFIIFV
jgi:hypothetical protein